MNNLDIANEALGVIARLALLIRSSAHHCGLDANGEPTKESLDIYWLGDALHNIGYLHARIAEGEFNKAAESFDRQIGELDCYISEAHSASSRGVAMEAMSLLKGFQKNLSSKLPQESSVS